MNASNSTQHHPKERKKNHATEFCSITTAGDPATAHIPVLMCTILHDESMALSLGAAEFLTKPVDKERLATILAGLVAFLGNPPERTVQGTLIDYRITMGPAPMRWRTKIAVWEEGVRFVDTQLKGPYSLWWHEHRFEARGDRTVMHDVVYFTAPLGPLGRLAEFLMIRPMLRRIFRYRAAAIRRLFPSQEAQQMSVQRRQAQRLP